MKWRWLLFVWLLAVGSGPARGQIMLMEMPVLNPATYRSPSGRYVLEVEPGDARGKGAGSYRLLLGEKVVWRKPLPYTFREAVVADDGTVAGYAYQEVAGAAPPPVADGLEVEAHIVFLGPRGNLLEDRVFKPGPSIEGLLFYPDANRLIVRLDEGNLQRWAVYEMSTGTALRVDTASVDLPGRYSAQMTNARVLPGTSLTLISWKTNNDAKPTTARERGALFTLMALDGTLHWKHFRPAAYTIPGEEGAIDSFTKSIPHFTEILEVAPDHFDLWYPKEKKRARFQVSKKGDDWQVKLESLTPFAGFNPFLRLAEVKLPKLGEFTFGEPLTRHPAREIRDWAIDGEGRFGLIREEKSTSFLLVDRKGKVLADLPFKAGCHPKLAWLGGAQWVVTGHVANVAKAWRLDAAKGTLTALKNFTCRAVDSITGLPDGGFAVTTDLSLMAFDQTGRKRWVKDVAHSRVTTTSRSELAVLDIFEDTIQLFDAKGNPLRQLPFGEAVQGSPTSPGSIFPDVDGGLVAFDHSKRSGLRVKADGTLGEWITPAYATGHKAEAKGIRAGPDGALWFADSDAIYRLTAEGKAAEFIGEGVTPDRLRHPYRTAGDGRERLYATDLDLGFLHVFDAEGKSVKVISSLPADFKRPTRIASIGRDGSACLTDEQTTGVRLWFDADGRRVGLKPVLEAKADPGEQWLLRDGMHDCIVLTETSVLLADHTGKIARRMERGVEQKWLGFVDSAAIAPDRSFVVASSSKTLGSYFDSKKRAREVTIFSAVGEPVKTWLAPAPGMQLCGMNAGYVIGENDDGFYLIERATGVGRKLVLPRGDFWSVFLMREGRELWVAGYETRKVTRYAMPEGK